MELLPSSTYFFIISISPLIFYFIFQSDPGREETNNGMFYGYNLTAHSTFLLKLKAVILTEVNPSLISVDITVLCRTILIIRITPA